MNMGSRNDSDKKETVTKILMRGNRKLEYEIWGNGEPFVFLHGMGGSIEQIRRVYNPMEGIRMIVPNQQGHGGSEADWEQFDFDHLADDMVALLEELQIASAFFAGISMGAAICLNLAVRYPERVRKLLLIRNAWLAGPMPEGTMKAYEDLAECLHEGGCEEFYKTEGWKVVADSSPYTRNAFTSSFQDRAALKYWQKYSLLPKEAPVMDETQIQNLKMPVFIIANRNDLCHPFEYGEYLHKQIHHSRFYEVPDKDHDEERHRQGINDVLREMVLE